MEALVDKSTTMAEAYVINQDPDQLDNFMREIPEDLHEIYKDTRGILVYQEQIMQLCMEMAGYTLGGADILRRAIGKKDKNLIQAVRYEFVYGTDSAIPLLQAEIDKLDPEKDKKRKETFEKELKSLKGKTKKVEGCISRGYTEDYAIHTYDAIERFSGYSFNRSHSAAYGMVAYQTAYMKAHFPVEFMAAQLTVDAGTSEDVLNDINECRRLGIKILPPDINKSQLGFSIELVIKMDEDGERGLLDAQGNPIFEKAIRFGLKSISGVGDAVIEEIMRRPARDGEPESAGQPYKNFDDFFDRVDKRKINKNYLEKLIQSGCFDYDISNRYQLLNHFYFNLRGDKPFLGTRAQFDKAKKDKKIKADTAHQYDPKDYDEDVICEFEQNLFGFYLTYHPYADLVYTPWDDVLSGQKVEMGGKIVKMKKLTTRKGDEMAFLDVETAGGKIEVTVFPKIFEDFEPEFFKGNIAIFRGRKEMKDGDKSQLILEQVLKVKKKKFVVEKPPELAELAAERRAAKKGKKQLTLDDLGGPNVKSDPLADAFVEMAPTFTEELRQRPKKDIDELGDLASLFD